MVEKRSRDGSAQGKGSGRWSGDGRETVGRWSGDVREKVKRWFGARQGFRQMAGNSPPLTRDVYLELLKVSRMSGD